MIYLSKILPVFVLPIGVTLLLIAAGVWLRRRTLIVAGAIVLFIASLPVFGRALMRFIEEGRGRIPVGEVEPSDAIVVLSTGRVLAPGPEHVSEWTDADRFFAGVDLLRADKAPRLVFTGGTAPRDSGPLEGDVLRDTAVRMGVVGDRIVTTGAVVNTAEEAAAVAKLRTAGTIGPHIILVTSAFHVSRARRLFEQAGFSVTPFPVDFSGNSESVSVLDLVPTAGALAQTQVALREIYGRAYYRVFSR